MKIENCTFLLSKTFLANLILSLLLINNVSAINWNPESEWSHSLTKLSNNRLYTLSVLQSEHNDAFNKTLDTILIPRVVGTEGNRIVREYIVDTMKDLGWFIEEDSFDSPTPLGKKPFTNVIATLDPDACRRLVIACHHDSLPNRESTFVGATDSAVPCSMMINLAQSLDTYLKKQKEKSNQLTLQFIFFDGEEALQKWSDTDSLYGSKHLAAKWNKEKVPQMDHCTGDFESQLDRIDVFLLLDLIGGKNPKFYNYFPDTRQLYGRLVDIEKRLTGLNQFVLESSQSNTNYFNPRGVMHFVDDDHAPFMKKGVPIIHLIPTPFPGVWHKESDNKENLHYPSIKNLMKVLSVFISEYLHLTIPE